MARFVSATRVAAVMLLAACGSTRKSNTEASPAPAPAAGKVAPPAPAIAQSQVVRIPSASGQKVVLNMTGPTMVTEAKDWVSFKEEWRATFAEHAKEQGVAFSMQDGEARALGEPGTLLNVHVNDYRQVGIGARIFLGS